MDSTSTGTKKNSSSTSASKSTFDLASVIFEKEKCKKSLKGNDSMKSNSKSTAIVDNAEKVACSQTEMAARNRPSTSRNKDDAIFIETTSESLSKDMTNPNSQTFAEFKAEMHEMHKKSFEEIQLIIANSFENLRQPAYSRLDKRPTCGRKRVISESDVNNDKSEGEISENSDSDFPLTQHKYKIPKLDKKRAGEEDLDIVQQIDDLLNQPNVGDRDDREKDDLENDFEKFLEQEYSAVDKVGNDLPAKVAEIIKHMFKAKQADDRLKEIMEKFLRPGNIEIYPQKINPEIWCHLKKDTQFKDIDSFKLSEKLIKCSYAVMSLVELLLKSKKQDKKSEDIDKSLSSGIKVGMDALSLLGHIMQDHNQLRRDCLKVDLNLQYKKLCNPSHNTDTGSSKWLFGDELGKRVKDIKETNQVGSSVASGSRQYKNNSRFNSRSKPFLFQGNSRYKRPPQNQNQYRFSNKKYNSHQKSSYNQNKKNLSSEKK